MRKILLVCLGLLVIGHANAYGEDYPDPHRFVEYNLPSQPGYLKVDTRTGCEYFVSNTGEATLVEGSCKHLSTNPESQKGVKDEN